MEEPRSALRIATGFVVAPFIPCIVFAAILSGVSDQWHNFWFGAVAMIIVAEVLSLVIALPLYIVLRRFRSIGLLECVLTGIVVTVILNIVSLMLGYSAAYSGGDPIINEQITAYGFVSALINIAIQSILGIAIALTFWFISIRGRSHEKTQA